MLETPTRERDPSAKRARIAEAGLELFQRQGFTETTIDQIAAAARVGRRTVFHHFPTKEAVLFDHFVVRREVAIQHLRQRPSSEPPLVSLHAVLRELSVQGYEGRTVTQIRAVIASEPRLAAEQFSMGTRAFETKIAETMRSRCGAKWSSLEIHALTRMALGWFTTAAHSYITEGRSSLVECFDEVVAACVRASSRGFG